MSIRTTEKLKEIFNLPTTEEEKDIFDESDEETLKEEIETEVSNPIEQKLENLASKADSLLEAAKYAVESSPDPEAIDAASKLIKSTLDVISELNKARLLKQNHEYKKELEMIRMSNKKEFAQMMITAKASLIPQQINGNNNVVNVQQNNIVSYSQEDMIKNILEARKKEKLLTTNSVQEQLVVNNVVDAGIVMEQKQISMPKIVEPVIELIEPEVSFDG